MDNLYADQEDLLLKVLEQSDRLNTRNIKYSLYYTNAGYHTASLQILIELMKIKFNNNNLILAMPDSEVINLDISALPNCVIVKDFNADLPPTWDNVIFFNFTLLALTPRIFKVNRCVINYIAEDNLNLVRFASIRDRETLVNKNLMRPTSNPNFNINTFISPFRLVLNYYRSDNVYTNLKLKLVTDAFSELSTTEKQLISPMATFYSIDRHVVNMHKLALQNCFKYPSVFIYLFSDDNFNKFLSQLYREELWVELLFTGGGSSSISPDNICKTIATNKQKFFLRLNNLPIYFNMTMDNYIKWQLWALFIYGVQKNLITCLPTEAGIFSRPFITSTRPCITLRAIDGLVVNPLCTRSDFGVVL